MPRLRTVNVHLFFIGRRIEWRSFGRNFTPINTGAIQIDVTNVHFVSITFFRLWWTREREMHVTIRTTTRSYKVQVCMSCGDNEKGYLRPPWCREWEDTGPEESLWERIDKTRTRFCTTLAKRWRIKLDGKHILIGNSILSYLDGIETITFQIVDAAQFYWFARFRRTRHVQHHNA